MKLDTNLFEALQWEHKHDFRTQAEITRLEQQEEPTPATVMTLQESHEPTSDPKSPRFDEEPSLFSTRIDLTQYVQYKSRKPALRQPAVPATEGSARTLSEVSEVELMEARNQLHSAATAGEPVAKLPAGIHARLFRAIVG
jgi:hypothetical protein